MTTVPRPLHPGRLDGGPSLGELATALDRRDAGAAVVVAATFNCCVAIGPSGGTSTWNTELGQTVTSPADAVYSGPAGVGPASSTSAGTDLVTAEDLVAERLYEIELPHDVDTTEISIDHVVTVTSATDPRLSGARLTVSGFEDADRTWTRVLYAVRTDG